MSVEQRLIQLGIELPELLDPVGNYVRGVQVGDLVFLSGHGPRSANGASVAGKVGADIDIETAQRAARLVGLNMLASLEALIGDLNRVKRVVKVLGMVNAVPEFKEHPKVIDGFSDLMVAVFGEAGRGARSAVGMGSLPAQIPVEVEMIVELS
ncbi:MAG: RidA family protein [Alphaproteobacteria bacterium]|jgi:enamine deaminase RidA (YjgF/YER057c/UK114 family)|nr:RidA family protein [Alphaproteobacteria bacterium]